MRAAGISPAATAAFFERIGGKEEGREARAMSWLSSHPLSAERRRRFTAAVKPGAAYRPALDQAQCQALRTSCASDRKVAKFWVGSFSGGWGMGRRSGGG